MEYFKDLELDEKIVLCGKVGVVRNNFISNREGGNDVFFNVINQNKIDFSKKILGYAGGGGFPITRKLKDLETLCNALEAEYQLQRGLPERWCIEVTDENKETLLKYSEINKITYSINHLYLNFIGKTYCSHGKTLNKFKEITLEQFEKHILGKKEERMYSITAEDAKRIIDIACINWREKLAKEWATQIVLDREVEISEEFYKSMREACTTEQHKLFDDIFGGDGFLTPEDFEELRLFISNKLNYETYKKLPGRLFEDKAKYIDNLLKEKLG
jgi:hypothetical protein